jgi:four helix bundle protein
LQIAMGSASELEYHILLAHDLDMLRDPDYKRLSNEAIEVKRVLAALIHRLRANS